MFLFSSKQKKITVYSPHTLQRCDSSKHTEAVMCIYIRSLDQARGLLAHGALVFLKAVSSNCRHLSSGYTFVWLIFMHQACQLQNCNALFVFHSKYFSFSSLFYLLIFQQLNCCYYFVEQSDPFSVSAVSLLPHFMPHIIQKI